MFGRTRALTQRKLPHGDPFPNFIPNSNEFWPKPEPNRRWRLTPSPNPSPSQHTLYPARFPQCPGVPENCTKAGLKIYRGLLPAYGSTGMLTCRWWQLCVRRQSGNWATVLRQGRAPIYFPNRTSPRLNRALLVGKNRLTICDVCSAWMDVMYIHWMTLATQNDPIFDISIAFYIFVVGGDRDLKFGG